MSKGHVSRYSLRSVRLLLAGLLLASVAFMAGLNSSGWTANDTSTPPALADHTGGATGGG